MLTPDDYVDEQVSYFLGMLFGHGQRIEERAGLKRIVISLDVRTRLPKLPPGVAVPNIDVQLENERALNHARRYVNELLDANVEVEPVRAGKTTLSAVFVKKTIGWRAICELCGHGTDRSNFVLPEFFSRFPRTILEEFVRGFADVAVTPNFSDNAWGSHARIAFPVVHGNLPFAKQLVELLEGLGIEAPLLEGSAAKRGGRVREHRVRPYADVYLKRMGSGFRFFLHKQSMLEILAKYNRDLRRRGTKRREEPT